MTAAPMSDTLTVEEWIEREFSGHGTAIRRHGEAPYPGEPYMSMADAKKLTRRAVEHFAREGVAAREKPEGVGPEDYGFVYGHPDYEPPAPSPNAEPGAEELPEWTWKWLDEVCPPAAALLRKLSDEKEEERSRAKYYKTLYAHGDVQRLKLEELQRGYYCEAAKALENQNVLRSQLTAAQEAIQKAESILTTTYGEGTYEFAGMTYSSVGSVSIVQVLEILRAALQPPAEEEKGK